MEQNDPIHAPDIPGTPDIDISHKLTHDDIDRIEKYRQTRKTSVLAILFTDIVGYTDFTYRSGEQASARLRHIHDEIIISQVKKESDGEIIKQIGDSFLIVFSDPALAVRHALKLQELFRLNLENLTYEGYTLAIRIGMHMGQVSVEDHIVPDVFGTHINLASRVMSLSAGGQVLVTGSVWENASGWLKDEQRTKIHSAYYGKIKLKGIGKSTEIYEFYSDDKGKVGIPKPIARKKHKMLILKTGIVILILTIITIPIVFLMERRSLKEPQPIEYVRGQLVLANLISTDKDTSYAISMSGFTGLDNVFTSKIVRNLIEPIDPGVLEKINENYHELLKTSFIVEFDIRTEEELKLMYAKKELTLPQDLREDTIFITRKVKSEEEYEKFSYAIIKPWLYKIKSSDKYWLMVEQKGSNGDRYDSKIIGDIDSVPYIINELTRDCFVNEKKEHFFHGEITKINGEDVIIKFKRTTNLKILVPGVTVTAARKYNGPYLNVTDQGVVRRLKDLEKPLKYYGSSINWIKNVDSMDYWWSYAEFTDLKKGRIKFGANGGLITGLGINLKIIQVYDSTALATIQKKKYPWMDLEIGDGVELK